LNSLTWNKKILKIFFYSILSHIQTYSHIAISVLFVTIFYSCQYFDSIRYQVKVSILFFRYHVTTRNRRSRRSYPLRDIINRVRSVRSGSGNTVSPTRVVCPTDERHCATTLPVRRRPGTQHAIFRRWRFGGNRFLVVPHALRH